MADALIKEIRRLFSSKTNFSKQVPHQLDTLHSQKLILLGLSIAFMLGYSQFRVHFICQGIDGVDSKMITNFCWLNGTTTVINTDADSNQVSPHPGHNFYTGQQGQRIIGHNYMRSLWALLVLLVLCSYLARRRWASIFNNELLRALLQLKAPEEASSKLALAAEKARPYEMLTKLSSDLERELDQRMGQPEVAELPKSEQVTHKIDIVDSYVNVYDHTLDYYPNQLTYLLLTRNTSAYKLSCLNLRRQLLTYCLCSSLLSVLQFLLPLTFIGPEYLAYGWNFLVSFAAYLWRLIKSDKPILDNSIDYELSSSIFPISTQCDYQRLGIAGGTENTIVQCTVGINEICAKLFVAIWWLVVVDIVVELWSLAVLVLSSLNRSTIRWSFGMRFWPHARKQADLIASFRHRRAVLLKRRHRYMELAKHAQLANRCAKPSNGQVSDGVAPEGPDQEHGTGARLMPIQEQKRLEAECGCKDDQFSCSSRPGRLAKRWYQLNLHDLCSVLAKSIQTLVCCCTHRRRRALEKEPEVDINLYYLLYLLHLRLGESKSLTEEVIRMTGSVLNNYLDELESGTKWDKTTSSTGQLE